MYQLCILVINEIDTANWKTQYHTGAAKCTSNHFHIGVCICRDFSRTLRWRHNGNDSVSNHQPHHCLINRLFRRISKKTSKLRVTGLCAGNSPETGEFPAQMASNAENVSIWWRHHDPRRLLDSDHCNWTGHDRMAVLGMAADHGDNPWKFLNYIFI